MKKENQKEQIERLQYSLRRYRAMGDGIMCQNISLRLREMLKAY